MCGLEVRVGKLVGTLKPTFQFISVLPTIICASMILKSLTFLTKSLTFMTLLLNHYL